MKRQQSEMLLAAFQRLCSICEMLMTCFSNVVAKRLVLARRCMRSLTTEAVAGPAAESNLVSPRDTPLGAALVADASASDKGTVSYRQETTAVSSLVVGMDFNTELWVIMSYLDKGS
eukprot:FR737132.1.p1 GENE.FR737132.1~~FR737132.1.p1  ORF type:complete len:117 (+),score=5.52 FR737132.1:159-509(+)